jgi:hypothetical protein
MPVRAENVPGALRRLGRWLVWSWVWNAKKNGGKGGWDKPPLDPRTRRPVDKTDPKNWLAFEAALRLHQAEGFDGVGIELGQVDDSGLTLAGVDLDDVRDPATGQLRPWAEWTIRSLDTYAEVSPSRTGVKLLCWGTLPKGRRNGHDRGVEMYDGGCYFTVTGHRLDGAPGDCLDRQQALERLHAELLGPERPRARRQDAGGDDRELAREALGHLAAWRSRTYPDWLAVGMALHSAGDDLLGDWDSWSRQCSEKYEEGACAAKWRSFTDGGGLTLGSLLYWAQEDSGWTPAGPRGSFGRSTAGGSAPPPRDKGGAAALFQWSKPLPLADAPGVPPFPLHVFPDGLQRFATDAAEAAACPVDYVAGPMLALAGAAIGASRALQVKQGYSERAALYLAVAGLPGGGKTPALKAAAAPFHDTQARLHAEWRQAVEDAHAEAEKAGKGARPKLPQERLIFVDNVTVEVMGKLLEQTTRGLVMITDELTAWVARLNQYKRGQGDDRQFYLSAWAGQPVSVHRKNPDAPRVYVAHPFVAVVGGLPPDMVTRLCGERRADDGFLDRILFVYPDPPAATGESWRCVGKEEAECWRLALLRLFGLEQEAGERGPRPRFVHLTSCGRRAWEVFTTGQADDLNAGKVPDHLRGPWSKFRGYCARLSLVLHFLRCAAGEAADEDVDGQDVEQAAELVAYFQGHARRVYHALGADARLADARKVLQWLRERPDLKRFTRRDVHQGLRGSERFTAADGLDAPLQLLERHGYVRKVEVPHERGPGRPSDVYVRNPEWEPEP